jgi:proteic killer suppression protein
MTQSFRHKGLRLLFDKGDRRKVLPGHADKIERFLARPDQASRAEDMNLPGCRLHALRGDRLGYWAVSVSGNWRIVFRFAGGHAGNVDLIDYH